MARSQRHSSTEPTFSMGLVYRDLARVEDDILT
jgi:hypothetical protein